MFYIIKQPIQFHTVDNIEIIDKNIFMFLNKIVFCYIFILLYILFDHLEINLQIHL